MPRGRLVTPKDDLDAIRLFTEKHIVQFRRGTSGRITEVDHVQFGWMKPERYYQLQKLHDAMPLMAKAIEGGYRMKAALWNQSLKVEVLGTGVSIPMSIAFTSAALGLYVLHTTEGKQAEALLDIAALFLPFGELWYFYLGAITIPEVLDVSVTISLKAAEGLEAIAKFFADLLPWFPRSS